MDYIPLMTTATSSSDPYRICCLCNEDVPADRVIHTGVGAICADQYACEVRQGRRLVEGPFVCVNCDHEHHYEDDTIVCEGKIFCADEDACERRMGRMEPLPDYEIDWSDPPEDAAPAHLDGTPDEGQPGDDFYGDDAAFDEYRMDHGWDD